MKPVVTLLICIAMLTAPVEARIGKRKPVKPKPARPDAAFQQKLLKDEQVLHALDRLTFGPRAGDFEHVRKMGVKKWVNLQLHPERIAEDPALRGRLAQLETLDLDPLQVWERYPQTPFLLAMLRGKPALPDDPQLRATTEHYASYFTLANDNAELAPAGALEDFLSPDQVQLLRSGKPPQKQAILAAIPEDRWDAFIAAMDRNLRNQVQSAAPVPMRRRILMFSSPQQVVAYDLISAKLLRAIYSERQFAEQLTDFWYNHFNVYLDKGNDRFLVPAYERDTIRPRILGSFRDLLMATAHSPAMLFYLDNYQSAAPPPAGSKPGRGQRGLNENYARELLELHTLGVDGGYTQKDIIEVARCFTGWTVRDVKQGSAFWFNEKTHDKGEKVVLGETIPAGGGEDDGLRVLEILARHPATAHFISKKLAQRFVADAPPESLVNRMAETFRSTSGDIRSVLATMLESKEFWSQGAYKAKMKSPLEMVASAARATGAEVHDPFALSNQIATLGEPLYRKVEPTGYLNTSEEWVNSASLLTRMNFALNFARNRVLGVRVTPADYLANPDEPSIDRIAERLLFALPTKQTRTAIEAAVEEQQRTAAVSRRAPASGMTATITGLVLGSPDFQRR